MLSDRVRQLKPASLSRAKQQLGCAESARSQEEHLSGDLLLAATVAVVVEDHLVAAVDFADLARLGPRPERDTGSGVLQQMGVQALVQGQACRGQAAENAAALAFAEGVVPGRVTVGPIWVVLDHREVERFPRQLDPKLRSDYGS